MLDYGKKALLLGLGTLAFSREKVEKLVDELIKKGELTMDEKTSFIDELVKEGEKQEERVVAKLKEVLKGLIDEFGIVRKDDLKAIEERLSRIEEHIVASEDKSAP